MVRAEVVRFFTRRPPRWRFERWPTRAEAWTAIRIVRARISLDYDGAVKLPGLW